MSKTYIAHLPERYIEKRSDGEEWLQMPVNVSGHELTIKTVIPLTPYTEPDLDAVRNEAYEKGVEDTKQHWTDAPRSCAYRLGYENGLNDAWDAARKIAKLNTDEQKRLFGCFGIYFIAHEFSAHEAIEKIRQYEQEQEQQIQVGDEVIGIYSSGEQTKPFVITKWDSDYYFGIYRDSGEVCQGGLKLQKTGRHFPEIAEVLRKMQEEKE